MRHGFLLTDKPHGFTSHDAVAIVRKRLSESKIGHLGTLDPAASGLLVLAVGSKALKVIEFFGDLSKEYEAEIAFGFESSTYDAEGALEAVEPKKGWVAPDAIQLRRVLEDRFLGKIQQVPPAHSAVKVGGIRSYALARKGKSVPLAPRPVEIQSCDVLSYAYPELRLRVRCGSGTYIRSLAHDLGQFLRCGAYLKSLQRTRVGEWSITDACAPDKAAWTRVLPLKDVLRGLHRIDVTEEEAVNLAHGRSIAHEVKPDTFAWCNGLPIAVLVSAKDGSRGAHPRKVL